MLATLVIFLREGVEASMIVAILLSYLNRIGRREHFRDVFIGVGAALILATAGGAVAYETIRSYDGSRVQTIFETVTYLVAATVLTYMTFWMRKHARSLSKELRARAGDARAIQRIEVIRCVVLLGRPKSAGRSREPDPSLRLAGSQVRLTLPNYLPATTNPLETADAGHARDLPARGRRGKHDCRDLAGVPEPHRAPGALP